MCRIVDIRPGEGIGSRQNAWPNIAVGGRKLGDKGYFAEPTVLVNTTQTMKIMQEEIFGPVVCAVPFTDIDEVLQAANDSIYGLAAAV